MVCTHVRRCVTHAKVVCAATVLGMLGHRRPTGQEVAPRYSEKAYFDDAQPKLVLKRDRRDALICLVRVVPGVQFHPEGHPAVGNERQQRAACMASAAFVVPIAVIVSSLADAGNRFNTSARP